MTNDAGTSLRLRPPHIGIFVRSFHCHSTHYARETIAEICRCGRTQSAHAVGASSGRSGRTRGSPRDVAH
jgi:hypothetical protein